MISRWTLTGCVLVFGAASAGCVTSREITSFAAHDTANNYKVQTRTVHFAFITAWVTLEVWDCWKDGSAFRCEEVDHERSRRGTGRPGGGSQTQLPPAVPSASAAPAQPASPTP
jgi:hypothetical protein